MLKRDIQKEREYFKWGKKGIKKDMQILLQIQNKVMQTSNNYIYISISYLCIISNWVDFEVGDYWSPLSCCPDAIIKVQNR